MYGGETKLDQSVSHNVPLTQMADVRDTLFTDEVTNIIADRAVA
jgi:hypothetical protein